MPKKRKNGGKNRHNRGSVKSIQCDVTGKMIPKDKAIRRVKRIGMINAGTMKDLRDASYYDRYRIPSIRIKKQFCVSEAQYHGQVYKRDKQKRKDRNPPEHVLRSWALETKRERLRERIRLRFR